MSDLDRRVLWYLHELRHGDRVVADEWLRNEPYVLRVRVARALAAIGDAS